MHSETEIARIFHEAQVIDVDFSKWDKFIRLVVIALDYPADVNGRSSLFNIDFMDVADFRWLGHHVAIQLEETTQHCQWTIMKHKVLHTESGYEIWFGDVAAPSPELTVRCRSVAISPLSWDLVFAANPRWHGSHLPLARPSLEEIGVK